MRGKLILGVSLLLAAATSFAGSAGGQFDVQITLNDRSNNICITATGSGADGSSVQVRCSTANVFVKIAQGRVLPVFRPARDTLLPDYCRNEQMGLAGQTARITCGVDDAQRLAYAGDDADDGWKVGSQLYAVDTNATATQAQTQARLLLQDNRGTLTTLRVAHADGHFGSVEMLVSF